MEYEEKGQTLSVIVPSVNGLPIIGECLDSLTRQVGLDSMEVIVANRCSDNVAFAIQQKYPGVKLINAPADTSIPRLRAMAFQECQGDVLAVLEDHCIVGPDWAAKMLKAHRSHYPVIGGSVENAARARLVDWAHFFCEYSQLMNPLAEGEADFIPGNNVGYKRWILDKFWPDIEAGIWDCTLHEKIRNAGIPLYRVPSLTVHHKMSASLWWFVTQKFHFARSFSSMRFVNQGWLTRAIYGAGAAVLPLILFQRIFRRVWRTKSHRRELLLSFPALFLLLASLGVGEAAGYILGPGSSHAKVA